MPLEPSNEPIDQAWAEFRSRFGDHDCPQDDTCTQPGAFYILFTQEDGSEIADLATGVHQLSTSDVVRAFVGFIDQLAQEDGDEGIPAVVKFSRGRELIRRASEQIAPPGEVSSGLGDLLSSFFSQEQSDE